MLVWAQRSHQVKRVGSQTGASDEALVALVVERDLSAFTCLYDRYAPAVYAFAAHMLGKNQAEEVVQDVFLRLWQRSRQFDQQRSSFRAWFMAIARHQVWDELRRKDFHQGLVASEAVDALLAGEDPATHVVEEAWRDERSRAVLEALKGLPTEQRRVLVLAYFGGLSQSAIAHHLGWPLGTVKKRTRLGLQKLRAWLGR
ncbi:MAG: sigma-70 family RNA polymerase sigma factor [Chloroflexi bacterium]|nr:sigma-70 family RNA polymerase sigma factor [Chloroflexota bacterium]